MAPKLNTCVRLCGIVGYVGERDAVPLLVGGLVRLEYRGYDSAGVAVASARGVAVRKLAGRIVAITTEGMVTCGT